MPNNINKVHTFLIPKFPVTNALRPLINSTFPIQSQNVLGLQISNISIDLTDPSKVRITFEETIIE